MAIVPRKSLVSQAIAELEPWGLDVGAIAGNFPESRRSQVQVATYQSLATRDVSWLKPDTTILDEVHLSAFPKSVTDFFPVLGIKRKSRAIGVTATPRRLDKSTSLGQYFDYRNMIFAPSIAQLIDMGYLVRPMYNICPNAVSGRMVYDPDYVLSVYEGCDRRPSIVFAPNVAQARATLNTFLEAGIAAELITGSTSGGVRKSAFSRFKSEELPVLINCAVLREGIDLPVATNLFMGIDPDSHSSYVQAIGRVLRPAVYADRTRKTFASIYDLTGCVDRHGRVELLEYTEDDIELPDIFEGTIPLKPCMDTDCKIMSRIAAETCKCGEPFDINRQRIVYPNGDPFALLSGIERIQKAVYEDALLRAFELGDRPIAARNEFYEKFGFYPPLTWRRNFASDDRITEWLLSDGAIAMVTGDRQLSLELSHIS